MRASDCAGATNPRPNASETVKPDMSIRYEPIDPPDWRSGLKELKTPLEFLKLARAWRHLPSTPSPRPRTVVLLPGFGAYESSMALLGRYLRRLGHDVHGWGLGRNTGQVPELLDQLGPRIASLSEATGAPLIAVGWSLGGYLAREAARDDPARFEKIVTIGSPVIGGPRFTAAAKWYQGKGFDLGEIERLVAERYCAPLQTPVTAIYSRSDGVVAWEACIDHWSPNVRHVEVDCSHLGMGFSPEVIAIVADAIG